MTRASSPWSFCSASMRCVNRAQHTTWPSDAERMTEEACTLMQRLIHNENLVDRS